MEQFQEALTAFMNDTENRLKTLSSQQLQTLNLQKEYEVKVRGEVSRIINESYAVIENEQEKVFNKMQGNLQKAIEKIIKDVDHSADICRRTSKHAKETSEKLFKLKTWWDLIWYASPIAVFLNLVWRVFQYFAGA
jgi:superfamily II helicase